LKNKIFIIGVNGFLGSSLAKYFYNLNYEIIGIDCTDHVSESTFASSMKYYKMQLPHADITNVIKETMPDYLIYAAGSASVQNSFEMPHDDFYYSVNSLLTILDNLRLHSRKTKVLFFSSAAVYGNAKKIPISEECDLLPISPYGYHKLICEQILREYNDIYGVKSTVFRIFSVYGKGLHTRIFWDICQQVINDDIVQLGGSGDETRDFINLKDFCEAVELVLKRSSFNGEIYNLASGKEVRIAELAKLVLSAFGSNKELNFTTIIRKGDPFNWCADITAIQKLGFVPKIEISQGINEYVKWFRETIK